MRYRALKACGLATIVLAVCGTPALGAGGDLEAYRVATSKANLDKLDAAGFDVGEGVDRARRTIDVVATAAQMGTLDVGARRLAEAAGGAAGRSHPPDPDTTPPRDDPAAGASDAGFTVWTKYDAFDEAAFNAGRPPDQQLPVKEQYVEQYDRLVAEHPGLVAERVVGRTRNGRDIVALQVTRNATGEDVPGRPAVLYSALQHAREWVAGETCRRTLDYVVSNYGAATSAGREVTALVDANELWFACVANPDGYEYSFTPGHRLWRKNLRDNDRDGVITAADGVDLNRNFPTNWGRDDEGSSPDPSSETYRGPAAESEPETRAMHALIDEIHPVFQKSDHAFGQLLLYPEAFQADTPTADQEIFGALAGDPFQPAIAGFRPQLAAATGIVNGDLGDWAHATHDTLSFTVAGTGLASDGTSGFEYPDSPALVAQEFERHLPFALDLATSAATPAAPVSRLGTRARPIVVDDFPVSYGDPQPVQATLRRDLGAAQLRFRVTRGGTAGPVLKVPTAAFDGGERYGADGVYYHRVRGVISGTEVGDSVEAWFVAGGVESEHFTYAARVDTENPVLLLSDEDWTGRDPGPAAGPAYLDAYKDLLDQAGVAYDVYDVAAERRRPDALGILAHYSHVVWYTGDDEVTRPPGAPGDAATSGIDRLAVDTQNDVRDFLNEGGRLFYTGQYAGRQFTQGLSSNPFQAREGKLCDTSTQCLPVSDDFLQYWLGANAYLEEPGGSRFSISGVAPPFGPGPYLLADSHTATFVVTSSAYDPEAYPQWADSAKALAYDRPSPVPPPLEESPGVTTPDTFYTGFGLEKILSSEAEVALLQDTFAHLGAPVRPEFPVVTPTPVEPEEPGPGSPGLEELTLGHHQRLSSARARGVTVTARCTPGCDLGLVVRISPRRADRLGLRTTVIGRGQVTLDDARTTVRVLLTRRALRRLPENGPLRIRVEGTVAGDVQQPRLVAAGRLE